MSVAADYLASLRSRAAVSLAATAAAVALFSLTSSSSGMGAATGSLAQLIGDVQTGMAAGVVYTPAYVALSAGTLRFVHEEQLVVRLGGVGRSALAAVAASALVATIFSAFLVGAGLVAVACSEVATPGAGPSALLVSSELLAHVLYFLGCSLVMLVAFVLTGRRSVAVSCAIAYGLLDYFAPYAKLHDLGGFGLGWMNLHALLGGPTDALLAIAQLAGFGFLMFLALLTCVRHRDVLASGR